MCDECRWETYLETIEEAVADAERIEGPGRDFADSVTEKLEGIKVWVQRTEHITDAQADAVDNMAGGIDRWVENL